MVQKKRLFFFVLLCEKNTNCFRRYFRKKKNIGRLEVAFFLETKTMCVRLLYRKKFIFVKLLFSLKKNIYFYFFSCF